MPIIENIRHQPRIWLSAALLTAGLAGGAVIGTSLTAGATTATTTSPAGWSGSTGRSSSAAIPGGGTAPSAPPGAGHMGLPDSGTVSAVGTSSVSIDGTTYAVTSNSDIDKNGEATLSDLAVGDKVTFSTDSSASIATIYKLHAGTEALDRPTGPPPGAGAGGAPPAAAPSAGTSA